MADYLYEINYFDFGPIRTAPEIPFEKYFDEEIIHLWRTIYACATRKYSKFGVIASKARADYPRECREYHYMCSWPFSRKPRDRKLLLDAMSGHHGLGEAIWTAQDKELLRKTLRTLERTWSSAIRETRAFNDEQAFRSLSPNASGRQIDKWLARVARETGVSDKLESIYGHGVPSDDVLA